MVLSVHEVPGCDQWIVDGTARVVIFARLDNDHIAGLHRIVDTVDGQDARALYEDEDLVHVVHMTWLRMGRLTGLEDVDASPADLGIAE